MSVNYNRIVLVGRLAADPELRYTTSGIAMAKATIAVDDSGGGEEKSTSFIPMVFWRENAERLAQMGHKGNELLIEGKLKMRSWVDQQGQRKRVLEVMGDFFRMLSKREAVEAHESLDPDDDFGIFAGD